MSSDSLLSFFKSNELSLRSAATPHPLFKALTGALERSKRGEVHTGHEYVPSNLCVASDADQAGGLSHVTISVYLLRSAQSLRIIEVRDLSAGGLVLNDAVLDRVLTAETRLLRVKDPDINEPECIEVLSSGLGKKVIPMGEEKVPQALFAAAKMIVAEEMTVPSLVRRAVLDPRAQMLWPEAMSCVKDAVANLWIRGERGEDVVSFWSSGRVQKWRVRELVIRMLEGLLPG